MKKLKLNSSPYIVKNTNYSTITFVIYYPYKYDKIHMYDLELIKQLVMNYSYEYKSEQEFRKEKVKRLIIGFNCTIKTIHNNLFVIFTLTVPNPKIVKNFDIEDAFKFFYNTIYNPNIVNGEFDHNQFQREKEYIKFSIQNALKNISCDSYQRFIKYVDDIGDLKNNVYNNLELLEDSNPKSLYEYYKNIIINNSPVCIVYGDIDKDFIENLYYKYFKKIENEIIFDKDYDSYLSINQVTNYIEENSNYNQSVLCMAYKVENMCEDDKLFLKLLCSILNSRETNLIFKKLRLDNNLIYFHRFNRYIKKGMFVIEAYIDKINKDITIEKIKEILVEINDKELIIEYINKIIKGLEYKLIELKDSKYYELDKFTDDLFEFNYSLEYVYNFYKEIDIDDFMNFLSRIKLDTVYFFKGENNEE